MQFRTIGKPAENVEYPSPDSHHSHSRRKKACVKPVVFVESSSGPFSFSFLDQASLPHGTRNPKIPHPLPAVVQDPVRFPKLEGLKMDRREKKNFFPADF